MLEINKIYNQDCLEGMKLIDNESIDFIITDPPYGIDYQSSRTDKEKRHKKVMNDKSPYIWFLYDSYRVLKNTGAILCFTRWDTQEDFIKALKWAGFKVKNSIVWDRKHHGMGDLKSSFAPTYDNILFATKGNFEFPNKRPKDIVSHMRISGQNLTHPNEKPVELIEDLITTVSKENDLILDCFMGSGTTAVACINTDRKYIGFEIDKQYFDVAEKRIKNLLEVSTENIDLGEE